MVCSLTYENKSAELGMCGCGIAVLLVVPAAVASGSILCVGRFRRHGASVGQSINQSIVQSIGRFRRG